MTILGIILAIFVFLFFACLSVIYIGAKIGALIEDCEREHNLYK